MNAVWPKRQGACIRFTNEGALIGAFVPETLANRPESQPLGRTQLESGVGIMPNMQLFAGSHRVFQVAGPGTLYLGSHNAGILDDSRSIKVIVETGP